MKIKIYGSSNGPLGNGSYLLSKQGDIIPVYLHVPSTTFMDRGIHHLAPTDAEFLMNQGKIGEYDAISVLLGCFEYYLEQNDITEDISMIDITRFINWAELRYAPNLKIFAQMYIMKLKSLAQLKDMQKSYPDYEYIDAIWYPYVLNSYVKVVKLGRQVSFRISSEDNFDWNNIIIDKVLLNRSYNLKDCLFSILRESSKGYRAYFLDASLKEILERDKMILSSTYVNHKVGKTRISYDKR